MPLDQALACFARRTDHFHIAKQEAVAKGIRHARATLGDGVNSK